MTDLAFDAAFFAALLAASVRLAMPIAFAALGGVIAERSGVYNIALEGLILTGALAAAAGVHATGMPLVGLVAGIGAGAVGGLLVALLTVTFRVNQLVAGIAVNIFCAGLTAFLARAVFGLTTSTQVPGFPALDLGPLSKLPVIGPALFAHDALTYAFVALCLFVTALLFLTPWGLALRAAGENPRAADSAGLPVTKIRYLALIISGVLAALGGCHLVLTQVHIFSDGMSAGKGFLALAAIILGRWHPVGVALAALFFGLCDALQFRLQFAIPGVPYQIFQILPYLISIIALAWTVGRSRQPAAAGLIYLREQR
ncbi:ABC transporter permease [Bosea sp. NPDC003192]|uniref:ABC transporter permease n=1 Tax=Bosea sp. NPDC003192 TaxID=3390551 RepID=UPI003D094D4D